MLLVAPCKLGLTILLPYLATMLREVIHWGPTTPLGAPHGGEQDNVYNSYFVPKGSVIMPYIWCVSLSCFSLR